MIRNLLLLLVALPFLQNSYGQGAEIYGNCFYQNTTKRVIIRLALRNPTGANSSPMDFVGMRFGFQYNSAAVTYDGYQSYMSNINNSGLDDASYLSFIGPDTGPSPAVGVESPSSRNAVITSTGGTKTLQLRYINRSTTDCTHPNSINAGEVKILLDIYFTLVNDNPSYYHLNNTSTYGFGDPEFIAQFLTKDNGGYYGNLSDAFKEIAVVVIRQGNQSNLYQPFDLNDCKNGNVDPIVVNGSNVNFISPINGILSGKIEKLTAEERNDYVALNWEVENNEVVDHYEIERKDENGSFRTIGIIMSDNKSSTASYQFKDKITARDLKLYYRVKIAGEGQVVTYSDMKMVRPGSIQLNTLKIFPNPSSDYIRFNATPGTGAYVCRIYSNEGKVVMVSTTTSASEPVSIKHLRAGAYFIELYNPQSGKRFYSQFSKQ